MWWEKNTHQTLPFFLVYSIPFPVMCLALTNELWAEASLLSWSNVKPLHGTLPSLFPLSFWRRQTHILDAKIPKDCGDESPPQSHSGYVWGGGSKPVVLNYWDVGINALLQHLTSLVLTNTMKSVKILNPPHGTNHLGAHNKCIWEALEVQEKEDARGSCLYLSSEEWIKAKGKVGRTGSMGHSLSTQTAKTMLSESATKTVTHPTPLPW